MLTDFRVRSAVLAAVAAAAVSSARADSGQATRVVIRGTGNDVEVVYQVPAAPPRLGFVGAPAADPVREALALQASGAGDSSVVAFLQRRQADLPAVIDASVVREFARPARAIRSSDFSRRTWRSTSAGRRRPSREPRRPPARRWRIPAAITRTAAGAGYPFYGAGGYGSYNNAGRGGRGGFVPTGRSARPAIAFPCFLRTPSSSSGPRLRRRRIR